MAKRRKKKDMGMKILGIGLGTLALGGGLVVGGYMWWAERGKRELLEKQITEAGMIPATQATNGNGMAATNGY